MTGKEIFKIWAPAGAAWVEWVRPVPFAALKECYSTTRYAADLAIPNIYFLNKAPQKTAIILDLPSCGGIMEGLALAGLGFRPIPLYNGANEQPGARALVDNHDIERALLWGAAELEKCTIAIDAPPVFLLDSNRTHRYKMDIAIFDNSWDLYDQDLPSAEYFLENKIDKIIVRGDTIQRDLQRILYKFQKRGISILYTNGYEEPKAVCLKKPPKKRC